VEIVKAVEIARVSVRVILALPSLSVRLSLYLGYCLPLLLYRSLLLTLL
jgi:hypothetical protein